jgi:hypothetical protein|tara:strand:+ start:48 stop:683 length:636 start_codon:yes stop_codon:yes gene_type:complete
MNKEKIKKLIPHFGYAEKNLYSWKELEGLLNLRPFLVPNRLNIAGGGAWDDYSWFYSGWSTTPEAPPASVVKDMINKTTVYLQDCSRVNEKVNSFTHSLENILQKNTDCHIYFSFKKDLPGFEKHKDYAHNLILVAEGSIKCEIWIEGTQSWHGHDIIEKELKKGEYAFIPAEAYHRITPLTEKRLSLSFCSQTEDPVEYEEREWLKLDNL